MPSIRERVSAAYRGFRNPDMSYAAEVIPRLSPRMPDVPRERYALLRLQKSNEIYRELGNFVREIVPKDYERIRAIENPALQAVEFHVMHIFPGSLSEALPFELPADSALRLASERVLRWSWFGRQKDRFVDLGATYGDVFLRAWSSPTRVGIEVRKPEDVSDFEEDDEGNIVYLRLDVEIESENDRSLYRTEVWSKEDQTFQAWVHERGLSVEIGELPTSDGAIASGEYEVAPLSDFGYDFVPFVRASFSQGTEPSARSLGVFEPHREAIDELLRNGTVLRDRYFRHGKPLWQSVTALAKAQEHPVDYVEDMIREESENREITFGRMEDDELFVKNPAGTRLEALIPSIDWASGLAQIEDSRTALERSMSELRFFRGHDTGDPSGVAMEKHQAPAIRRAKAARGNYEEAIVKALKMCLSMGQSRSLFRDLGSIGSFESGGMDELTFTPRPIVPESEAERTAAQIQKAEMYVALREVSPELLRLRLIEDGYDEETARLISTSSAPAQSLAGLFGGGNLTT